MNWKSWKKFVRLHYDLDINVEGIETISHLLEKIGELQKQILQLKNNVTSINDLPPE